MGAAQSNPTSYRVYTKPHRFTGEETAACVLLVTASGVGAFWSRLLATYLARISSHCNELFASAAAGQYTSLLVVNVELMHSLPHLGSMVLDSDEEWVRTYVDAAMDAFLVSLDKRLSVPNRYFYFCVLNDTPSESGTSSMVKPRRLNGSIAKSATLKLADG